MSFAGQALAAEYLVQNKGKLSIGVHMLPKALDTQIAVLQLEAMGIKIDTLTGEQKEYVKNWEYGDQ